jgi:hypothetical protein
MMFEIGDKVRLIVPREDDNGNNIDGTIGKIVDIDSDWFLPYEVEFDNYRGLFEEAEIELVEDKQKEETKVNENHKIMFMRKDTEGNGYMLSSILDLNTGLNSLEMTTNCVDNNLALISYHKVTHVVFNNNETEFKKMFIEHVNKNDSVPFTVEKNGAINHG